MTTARKFEIGIAFLVVLFLVSAYIREREARVTAEAAIAAKTDAQKERDTQTAAAIADLKKQMDGVKTAPQAAQVIERYIAAPPTVNGPSLRTADPVTVVEQGDLKGSKVYDELPAAPDTEQRVILTDAQAQTIAKQQIVCDATQKSLSTCSADLADQKQATAVAVKALKGGSWMQRALRVAVPVGCAAGGAFAGGYLKGAQGAALGAVGAGVLCAIGF
jgi:hypothetical protein